MKETLKILLLFLLLGNVSTTESQDFWEQLYFPDSTHIMCIETNELGYIFVGVINEGNPGGLYRSVDNAQAWELVLDAGNFMVQSIAIDEAGKIYIGKTGFDRFMVSHDNGDSWEVIELPPPSYGNIMKILCLGQDTIFVSSWESEGAFITKSFNGGVTWDYNFITDHQDEYVSDIAISNTGDIYVSVSAFFMDMGGVYKSEDGGATWEYIGLLNHQVMTIEINSNNDIFTGDWWIMNNDTPGIHALYEGTNTFDLIFDSYFVTDIVIDPNDNIYAAANEGVVFSADNGLTFEQIEDELSATIEFLHISSDDHLYGIRFNRLVKSIYPIITGTNENSNYGINELVKTYPNPAHRILKIHLSSISNTDNFCEVFIYDIYGKLIFINKKAFLRDNYQLEIEISQLALGFYLIKIQHNGKLYNSSFIKK